MFALFFALIGGAGRILKAIPPVVWLILAAAAVVLIVGLRVQSWAHGMQRQIDTAHAETLVARGQRTAAVLYAVQRQTQIFADVSSIAALQTGLDRQNASLAAAETVAHQMTARQAQAAQQTAVALQARDRTIAGLRARSVAPDDCDQARALLRGN